MGAGPTGLTAAWRLASAGHDTLIIEQRDQVGGLAAAHALNGRQAHLGSHRIHPAIEPHLLAMLRDLLGDDLAERPRRGSIWLSDRWVGFPLRLGNVLRTLPAGTIGRCGLDFLAEKLRRSDGDGRLTFEQEVRHRLGQTIYDLVYAESAEKIWGVRPSELSSIAAGTRVAAKSLPQLARSAIKPSVTTYFYPRRGFQQIVDTLHEHATAAGAKTSTGARVTSIVRGPGGRLSVRVRQNERDELVTADRVVLTIPFTEVADLLGSADLAAEFRSVSRSRGLVLVYLRLNVDQFGIVDTYYAPSLRVPFSRISEQVNFSPGCGPAGETVLCAEVPCSVGDGTWNATDESLAQQVVSGAERIGLDLASRGVGSSVLRIRHAYPVYLVGHERWRRSLLRFVEGHEDGVVLTGRHPLFLQVGTHHAMEMGRAAAQHIIDGGDSRRWAAEIKRFFEFKVID